jgi:uncharacterized oxidoreductase
MNADAKKIPLPHDGLTEVLTRIFAAAGGSREEAYGIGRNLVEANLAGHDSHGVVRTPRYVEAERKGHCFFGRKVTRVIDSDAFGLLDGNCGFGQTIGPQAVAVGLEKAKQAGVSVIGLRNSAHIGRIGAWGELAMAEGFLSIHFVNVSAGALVAPFGGAARRMSTNPICIAAPNPDGDDFLLDFATSRIAEGKALVALKGGRQVTMGDLVDGAGRPTSDPSVLYGETATDLTPNPRKGPGALVAMGEHKGSGLSLACDLLAGALTGNGANASTDRVLNGMLSIYVSPAAMDDGHGWGAAIAEYVDLIRSTPPADPEKPVMIPGDPERKARASRMATGVPLDLEAWENILGAGESVGLERNALRRLVGQ